MPVLQVAMRGPVTLDTRVDLQLSTLRTSDPVALRSAAALGLMGSDILRISNPRWDVSLGASGLRTGALTAQYLGANGGVLGVHSDSARLQLLAGRSLASGARLGRAGSVWGAEAGLERGGVSWTVRAVNVDDGGATERALSAVSIGADFAPFGGAHLVTELAGRRFDGGGGLGASTQFRLEGERSRLDVRLLHAPGGNRAFAAARDGVFIDGAHSGDRWRVAANAWVMADDASATDALRSIGGSFTPALQITAWLDVGAIAQSTLFSVVRASGTTGSGQEDIGGRAAITVGGLRATGELLTSRMLQTAPGIASSAMGDGARRLVSRTDVNYESELGAVGVRTSFEAPTATQGGELMYEFRVERVRPFAQYAGFSLDAAVQRLEYAGNVLTSLQASAQVALPLQSRIVVAAQQDQFLRLALGVARPVFSVKVERTFGVDVASRFRGMAGVVYRDENANGRRDAGEPGVAGVVVRRGAESAVTDASGRYRLAGGNGPLAVDARTLPTGWLASSGGSATDLAVVRTGQLAAHVTVRGTELPLSSLGQIVVIARHSDGREWMVRAESNGVARFDAMPAGTYEVTALAPESFEPMVFDAVVALRVDASVAQSVELVAHPRPVRVFRQPSGSSAPRGSTTASPASPGSLARPGPVTP